MIELDDIRLRWQQTAPLLDERDRRLFAAKVKLATAGQVGRAVAAAAAAATAAGKQPLLISAFNRMTPQKRMQAMRSGDFQLIDDRDV